MQESDLTLLICSITLPFDGILKSEITGPFKSHLAYLLRDKAHHENHNTGNQKKSTHVGKPAGSKIGDHVMKYTQKKKRTTYR